MENREEEKNINENNNTLERNLTENKDLNRAYEAYFNKKIDDKLDKIFKKNNTYALIIRFFGILIIIVGVLVWSGITIDLESVSLGTLAVILLISCFIAFWFFVLAEVIQILHDIRFRLWMK